MLYVEWKDKLTKHAEQVSPYTDAFVARRKKSVIHPVHDFLFTYYGMSPQKLKQWVPSFQQELDIDSIDLKHYPWLNEYWFQSDGKILKLNPQKLNQNVIGLSSFVKTLCQKILERTPRFGCFGLHEWAMVYKAPKEHIRYQDRPLRLSEAELARFVESQKLCCTHYDAFRFFTEEAKPLNLLNPILETRLEMEQGGCVHANMDLYKWSTKLWPWIGSDFIAKAFFLALECRELDMRASPYDLTQDGFSPICIETEEGRKFYQKEQQRLTEKSIPLRQELLILTTQLVDTEPIAFLNVIPR